MDGNMWGHGIWVATFICTAVSFSVSACVGLTFSNFWLRLVFLIISSVLGFILYAVLGGVWSGLNTAEETAIHSSFRNHLPELIGGLVAISWYGTWRLPEKIVEIRNRTQAPRTKLGSGGW
jgi:hypothetical protein